MPSAWRSTVRLLRLVPAILAGLLLSGTAGAQFQIPLPPHATADQAFHIYSPLCTYIREDTTEALRLLRKVNKNATMDTVRALPRYTVRVAGADTIKLDEVDDRSCETWLPLGGPIGSEDAIRQVYGDSGVDILSDVASTFKSDQLFVQSSIVGGSIGPVYFKASYGQLFSSAESEEPGITQAELRDRSSNLLRLIQNGGSATARVIMPLLWGGGAASQQAAGVYFNAGVLGPLGESDSLRATVGLVTEGLISFAIRNVVTSDLDADLFFGVRPGYQYVFGPDGIIPGNDSRGLLFAQFAGGLRVGGESRFGIFLTLVPEDYRAFVPDLQFTVQLPSL
jgi:hypothetical protein